VDLNKLKNRSFLLRTAGTLVALVLLLYLFSQSDWDAIRAAFQQIPWSILALSLGLMFGSRFAVTARWHVLLRAGELKIAFGQTTRITFAGLFATNFLPTTIGGDVVRLAGALRLKFDPAISTASLIADRLVGMFGMALVLPWGIPGFFNKIYLPAISAAALAGSGEVPMETVKSRWAGIWKKIIDFSRQLVSALSYYLKRPGSLILSLIYSGIHMFCIFMIIYLLFRSEGEQITWGLVAGLYSLVYFVTLLPISFNGYGLQEISIAFIYSRVAGVTLESALTVALIFRTLMMLASLPGAFFISGILAGETSKKEN